ncbi:MAG: DUF480 domain-containing protein [Planctomycetaceae bacterium]
MTEEHPPDGDAPPIAELSSRQRRVLGVLVEKAFTTPEYYPLTLKAVTAGCNQKSNRAPVVQYGYDDVEDALEELRQLGLVALVHTESGRTERFRHFMRKRLTLTEPQLAILTELLLRGRQRLGELRGRASRMVPIAGLEQLREELTGLFDAGLAQAGGPLQRRGVEVDHSLYEPGESAAFAPGGVHADEPLVSSPPQVIAQRSHDLQDLKAEVADLRTEFRDRLDALQQSVEDLQAEVADLKRDLGV